MSAVKEPLRITIVQGPYYPVPALLNSGAEKVWLGLGQEFARRGHRVTQISRRYPGLPWTERIEGVAHLRLPSRDAPRRKLWYRAYDLIYSWRALRALPADANLVVTNCIWLPVLMRGRNGRRLYVHVARYPKNQMRLYRHAARLQAVSSAVATAIERELPEARERIVTIPPYLSNQPRVITDDRSFAEREQRILYLGRVHPEKGVHLLVKAFADLSFPGWTLEVAGSHEIRYGGGGENYLRRLREESRHSKSPVSFTGMLPEELLNDRYRRSSLLTYPSLAEKGESFGMVPLEAMACGCPAVVSDLACFRDFLVPEENGFVFDHRAADPVKSLRAVLKRVMRDRPARMGAARAGYATARNYTLDKVATRYLEDFEKVVAKI